MKRSQLLVERQRCETDIDPIKIVDHVEQHHEGNEPPGAFGENLVLFGHLILPRAQQQDDIVALVHRKVRNMRRIAFLMREAMSITGAARRLEP